MTCVLGMELNKAVLKLNEEGYEVRVKETRSKKGVEGGIPMVVRQRELGSAVELVYAVFKTIN